MEVEIDQSYYESVEYITDEELTDEVLSDQEYSSEEEQPSLEDLDEVVKPAPLVEQPISLNEVKPFEELKITTITLKIDFEGEINIADSFLFLPLSYLLPHDREYSKFPYAGEFGHIISLRYGDSTRGLRKKKSIKKKKKNSFKNALTLDIGSYGKNFSVKIYKNKIQICGVQKEEEVVPVFNELIKLLENINYYLLWAQENYQIAEKTTTWVADITYSREKEREILKRYYLNNGKNYCVLYSDLEDTVSTKTPLSFPDNINRKYAEFLLSLRDYELRHHKTFVKKIFYFLRCKPLIVKPVKFIGYYKHMINYNFSLGFRINRMALHRSLREFGVLSHYDNNLSPSVNIGVLCEHIIPITRKKKKISFLIYRSGSITLSGPCKDEIRTAYYHMTSLIRRLVLGKDR